MLAFLLAGCAQARIVQPPPVSAAAPGGIAPASRSLPVGEDLEYRISWWGIPVGTVTLSLQPAERKLVKAHLEGRSNRYLQAFYPVRVEISSLIDPETAAPSRFQAFVKRRWRVHESTITFDRAEGTAFHKLPKGRSATVPVGSATQDGLSVVYYVRTIDFHLGQSIPLEITADGKNWHLDGRILKLERMELKGLGAWLTVEGSAELAYPVPFFQGAKARIWFSADQERIPLLAKIHSRIGPVTVVLTKRTSRVSP
ncbi:MAG: DUF3108 domain-containing protein [Candidatus Omnitrophica bacterium]|nr:DUF3108 domain-containing protein [Candidatus Omnitrophota bacterium]